MKVASKSIRLFESNFWERLTHVHHNTPFFIFIPVILAAFYHSFAQQGLSALYVVGGFFGGLLVWTFFEYFLHRIVFHYEPTSGFGKTLVYLFHGVHHDHPMEADRLVMPPTASIPIASTVLGIHFFDWGLGLASHFLWIYGRLPLL